MISMRFLLFAMVAPPLAACASPSQLPSPAAASDTQCDAATVQDHIGYQATQGLGAMILKESGATTLRWGPPNGSWTMDYRTDRVNIRYDRAMKIIEITCG